MNIGEAIETIRKIKRLSQGDLAHQANITQSYLSLIENNKKEPNLKTLKTISSSLDIPLPFLLLYSINKEDVPENKQDSFQVIIPLIKSLLGEYVKTM